MPLRRASRERRASAAAPDDSKMIFSFLAQAQPAAPAGNLSGLSTIVWMAAMFIILYYVMIRPQSKRQKEQQRLIAALKTGDRVVTAAGIHGMITNVKDTTVTVKVADNVKIEMEKSAVTNVLKSVES
jgi:preprotein translocase subunit YajC